MFLNARWSIAKFLTKKSTSSLSFILIALFLFVGIFYAYHEPSSPKKVVCLIIFAINLFTLFAIHSSDLLFYRIAGFKIYYVIRDRNTNLELITSSIIEKCKEMGIEYDYEYDEITDCMYSVFQSDEDFNLLNLILDQNKSNLVPSYIH